MDNNRRIRPYHPADLTALYRICLQTAHSGKDASHLFDDPDLIGHIFAAPYAIFEPEHCFVLTEQEQPIGYILGTRDSEAFSEWCEEQWFPPLRTRYPLPQIPDESFQTRILHLLHKGHQVNEDFADYPAHLHIDLLPVAQGGGLGRKMMQVFLDALKRANVSAVHLQVGKSNSGAIQFYQKLGFSEIKNYEKSIAFGMLL
ncbi:GNAT family N-acetyltransferase [candidate division KSB1 bacterium]|nr:GNAT family N-acetyltransferase [candidate division KSB1 bacterium]